MSARWVNTADDDDDDDDLSRSSFANSDDVVEESDFHTHRSCGRHGSCDRNKHQQSLDNSITLNNSSKSNIVKGNIRTVPNEPDHQQKYDGIRWRRICSSPNCSLYLNGGVYFENWLCRKHYLIFIATDSHNEVEHLNSKKRQSTKRPKKKHQKVVPHQLNDKIRYRKRGDIRMNSDGGHQKYDGKTWRPVCNYDECVSFSVVHGYCHRHDLEIRQQTSTVLASLDKPSKSTSKANAYIQRPTKSTIEKVRKGDIQFVRQRWNGTKWYSLCHYYTRDCTRRSAGVKCAHLCDKHYKEYRQKQNDESLLDRNDDILLSPKLKRRKLMCNEDRFSSNDTGTAVSIDLSRANSTTDQMKQSEQCIQTDLTYPLESVDLRQGCFLVDDDSDDQTHSQSHQAVASVKKEEDNFINNKRKTTMDPNSLPLNCKVELIKLEI